MKGSAESSKNRLAEALKFKVSVDTARASVTVGELPQLREVHRIAPAEFQQGNTCKCLRGGGRRGLDASPGRTGVAKTFRRYVKNPEGEIGAALDGGGLKSAVSSVVSVNL